MVLSGWNRTAKYVLAGLGGIFCVAALLVGFFLLRPLPEVPDFAEARAGYTASDGVLLDRHGAVIHELRVDFRGRCLEWTGIREIAPPVIAAVIASEDRRFLRHSGFDAIALAHGTVKALTGTGKRGASTITMQLASLLDKRLKPEGARRSLPQKWQQIAVARSIETRWTKDQILEAYLNLVSFRGELIGIAAASRGLFRREPGGLDVKQSLILACLIRSPNAPVAAVTQRARDLAAAINRPMDPEALMSEAGTSIAGPYEIRQAVALAPHVAHYLLDPGQKEVRCSLDGPLQAHVRDLLKGHLAGLRGENVRDGAVLVVDNRSGEILAYVANSGADSSASWIDGIRARRQPGSTLKPFLYALAIDSRLLTAASLVSDTPLDIPTERGIYRPENYDRQFKGPVPARVALASSLNIPAVRVLMLTGPDGFVRKLAELGLTGLRDPDYYGYSLALGSLDTSLFEMVNAYRTLANGGVRGDMTFLPVKAGGSRRRVFSSQASFIVGSMLSDREARSVTFGFENSLATPFWSAAKTGTSKDMRDNWCLGFSQRYTVGVWVGNFSGVAMWDVSGVTGAAPIWHEVMAYLHKKEPSRAPFPPAGVVSRAFLENTGEAGRREWFIAGTEPASVGLRGDYRERARIVYPPRDVIFAVDPDIPSDHQRIFFEATGNDRELRWLLNGQTLGTGPLCGWSPVPGQHVLSLCDGRNRLLDEMSFAVRE